MNTATREIERRRLSLVDARGLPTIPDWLSHDRRRKEVEDLLHEIRLMLAPEIARKRRIVWMRCSWLGMSVTLAVLFMLKRGPRPSFSRVFLIPPDRAVYQWEGFRKIAMAVVLAFLMTGCSKGGDNAPAVGSGSASAPANVAGNWSGSATSGQIIVNIAMTLAQEGSTFSGNWSDGPEAGTVTGNVAGTNVTFTLAKTVPCAGSYSGMGSVSGNTLSASWSGSSCSGNVNASAALVRTVVTGSSLGWL